MDPDIESNQEDDPSSATENPSSDRPAKRRKLTQDFCDEFDTSGEENLFTSSPSLELHRTEHNRDSAATEPKPKSRHKIHIPKKSDLPEDAFFTQPPDRPSSPYRIDQFHWRKPKNPSPPPQFPPKSSQKQAQQIQKTNVISNHQCGDDIENKPTQISERFDRTDDDFPLDESYVEMLAELPSETFPNPDLSERKCDSPILISSQLSIPAHLVQAQRVAAPIANLRQTTLFGTQAPEVSSQTQSTRKYNWPLANRNEPPTHHKLDHEALQTWVYPTNLGTIRDYQYSIVARGLYHNMLVALPTGLGKTFIAATIMLNWFRWTTEAQICFVAPTKPLVSQQVKACFDIAGIPRSATTMLTGGISPGLRAEEWRSKRVFFMTPQTIVNDLKTGICDPKKLVLLVVDEAHRATGGYAYVEVVKFLKRFNTSFRVLALTATPGASIETVQEVIDGLGISRIEIRTEESLDIRQYVHQRKIETILFDNSAEIVMVMDLFAKALQPVLDKLTGMNAYWARDPMTLTPYGCNQARQRWMGSDAGRTASFGIKGMVNTIFSLLASLAHGIELLKFHGIGPFYHKVLAFRNELKGGKYAKQINESEPFQIMMSRVHMWINNPNFLGHPKLEYLQSVVMNHFLDAGEGHGASDPSSTKIMVFAHYRDSAEEIARVLRRNEPMVRPHVFVGQASSKGSDGMNQKKQLDIIQKFQSGIYNTLVATSIGEEGLDIGEVDLIICYDASASPIRMLQRMGRTGRKRTGKIVVTLMKGKEEDNFTRAKDNYEKMQQEISLGTRFIFHEEESRRIVPKEVQPLVDKRIIDIPPENTQADLPEPTKKGRAPKRPPKRFHMPDGVHTGFVKASRLSAKADGNSNDTSLERLHNSCNERLLSPEPIPSVDKVLLTLAEEKAFERRYLDIQGDSSQIVEVPCNDAFPKLQRYLRPTKYVQHSQLTKGFVSMIQKMHHRGEGKFDYERTLNTLDRNAAIVQAKTRASLLKGPPIGNAHGKLCLGNEPQTHERLASPPDNSSPSKNTIGVGISSSDYRNVDNRMSDFIDSNAHDDSDRISNDSSSPFQPLPVKIKANLSRTTAEISKMDGESENELPDLGMLVEVEAKTKSRDNGQRRSRKRIVRDDSDDD